MISYGLSAPRPPNSPQSERDRRHSRLGPPRLDSKSSEERLVGIAHASLDEVSVDLDQFGLAKEAAVLFGMTPERASQIRTVRCDLVEKETGPVFVRGGGRPSQGFGIRWSHEREYAGFRAPEERRQLLGPRSSVE